jgi:diguanylate cyclase
VWFFGAKMAKPAPAPPPKKTPPPPKPNDAAKLAGERAAMAANQVADLAQTVASDVGDHAAKMKAISDELAGVDRESAGANAAVNAAMDRILAANTELQERLEKAEKQLATQAAEIKAHESEARTDSLTGLANRRAFDDELKRRICEWQRKGSPCTLVMLDIDFFKKFNDTHGHQVGDDVLKQVAKVLSKQARDMDLPCRYGGEEFGVILPATEAVKACAVAERIRAAIEASTTVSNGKNLKVTCSLGVAEFTENDDVAQLIRRADDALYASKKAGRNCGHWNTGTAQVPITNPESAPVAVEEPPKPAPAAEASKPAEAAVANNGASFIQTLKRRVTESHRFGIPISVMFLRIADFDIVNRKYGSAIARQMVDIASPALQRVLREMDVMTKLDHGEIVVMMPGSSRAEGVRAAKRMQAATSSCVLPVMDRELMIAFNHGIAELQPNETAHELIARARQDAIDSANAPQVATK